MNFNTLIAKARSVSYGHRIRPVRDWLALLAVAAVLLIASVAWNVWYLYTVTKAPEVTEQTSTASPALNALPKAQAVLEARAAEEAKYRSFYVFVDPAH